MDNKKNNTSLSASVKEGSTAPLVHNVWAPYISRCTTGQFSKLEKGFRNHCGPTAVTNMLLTLQNREPVPALYGIAPEQLFKEVAALGKHILAYYNFSIWIFGGTTMFLTDLYIRLALRKYGLKNVHVTPHLFGSASAQQKAILSCLDKGSLIYLQLLKDPHYSSHHLLVSGYKKGAETQLILSDGWSSREITVPLNKLKRISFWEIRP